LRYVKFHDRRESASWKEQPTQQSLTGKHPSGDREATDVSEICGEAQFYDRAATLRTYRMLGSSDAGSTGIRSSRHPYTELE
jgi:hypothetical protein